jgi:hypothetical protein
MTCRSLAVWGKKTERVSPAIRSKIEMRLVHIFEMGDEKISGEPVFDRGPSSPLTGDDRMSAFGTKRILAAVICCDAQHHLTCSQAVGGLSATKR